MNKIDFRIRKQKAEDLNAVARLYALFYGDKMNFSKMKEKFLQISLDNSYIFLVAEKDQNHDTTGINATRIFISLQAFIWF